MPLSSHLAPGFIRLTYSGVFLPHHMIIPINFASTPAQGVAPDLLTSSGSTIGWQTGLTAYIAALASSFNTATKFGIADIYAVDPVTGIRTFIYTADMALAGLDAVNPNINSSEGVFVFKSSVGRPIKIYVMEGTYEPNARNVGVVPAGSRQDVIDYVLSVDNILYGRENAYPLAFQTFTSKINDVIRRRQGFSDV
jgi:hypothetical protein